METVTKKKAVHKKQLTHKTESDVRFSEVDALGIVWHGNYVKFFEDGREAFGKAYGLGYLDIHKQGYVTPIVKMNIDFKKIVRYGERIIIETTLIDNPASKIIFHYKIYRASDMELVATAESVQVFLTLQHELHITVPQFFEKWKKQYFN